jgi:hypothetical protein
MVEVPCGHTWSRSESMTEATGCVVVMHETGFQLRGALRRGKGLYSTHGLIP